MEHILRGGIDGANSFNGMLNYKEMRDKVVHQKEYVYVGQVKWVLKLLDIGIIYCNNCLATRP